MRKANPLMDDLDNYWDEASLTPHGTYTTIQLLAIPEVAERLKNPQMVSWAIRTRGLKTEKAYNPKGGAKLMFKGSDVIEWLAMPFVVKEPHRKRGTSVGAYNFIHTSGYYS